MSRSTSSSPMRSARSKPSVGESVVWRSTISVDSLEGVRVLSVNVSSPLIDPLNLLNRPYSTDSTLSVRDGSVAVVALCARDGMAEAFSDTEGAVERATDLVGEAVEIEEGGSRNELGFGYEG